MLDLWFYRGRQRVPHAFSLQLVEPHHSIFRFDWRVKTNLAAVCLALARPHFNARLPPQSSRSAMPVGKGGAPPSPRHSRPPFRPPKQAATHRGLVGADDSAVAVSAVTLSGRWARCHSWSLMAAVMERSPPKFNTQRRQRHQAALQRLVRRAVFIGPKGVPSRVRCPVVAFVGHRRRLVRLRALRTELRGAIGVGARTIGPAAARVGRCLNHQARPPLKVSSPLWLSGYDLVENTRHHQHPPGFSSTPILPKFGLAQLSSKSF